MPTLRELTTRYNLKFDDKSFKKADKAMTGLISAAKTFGAVLGGAIIARGFGKMIGLASDAEETINVLNETFGDNTEAVKEWAGSVAGDMKRSEFQMREMAGELGAVLNPLMEKNTDVAADMSTNLAALAVDLGSFFNKADDVALDALLSGLTGSSMPMRQFGVVLLDATLQAFALDKGIKTLFKDMTIAEKTALRYQFILDQTQAAQGDAKRTAEGFANASKGVTTALRDLGTRIGLVLLPAVQKLTNGLVKVVRGIGELVKNSNIIQAIFLLLGAAAIALGIKMAIAFAPALLIFAKWALIIGGIILIVDDLITLFKGGESVIGDFIDAIFGAGAAVKMVNALKTAFTFVKDSIVGAWQEYKIFVGAMADTMEGFINDFVNGWNEALDAINIFIDKAKAVWRAFSNALWAMIPEPVKKLLGMVSGGIKGAIDLSVDAAKAVSDAVGGFISPEQTPEQKAAEKAEKESRVGGRLAQKNIRQRQQAAGTAAKQPQKVSVPVSRNTTNSGTAINQNNNFNMNVSTNGKQDINAINRAGSRMSKQAASHQRRATLEAVKQRKAS
jgi:hypothetical protein